MYQRLIVVVGPSGAGKDTLLRRWRERLLPQAPVRFATRLITRPADPHSEAHEPVTLEHMQRLREAGALAFEWQANGLHYGVRRAELLPLQQGEWVVLNGSREHLPRLRPQAPGCRVVEVTAASALLQLRLQARARESSEAVARRMLREPPHTQADLTLLNDGDPDECVRALHEWWVMQQAAETANRIGGFSERRCP